MIFKDKVVLIVGASSGMGYDVAKIIAKEGCKLAIFARRENKLKEISEKLSSEITECIYKKCDVTNINDVKEAVNFTYEKFGRIDIAILTSGVLVPIPIENFNSEIIKKSMETNFFGYLHFIEQLFTIMKPQGHGIIAATSTLPDRRGIAGWSTYGCSKAAISWMMDSLRGEAKSKYNIDILTIKPGSVLTPMINNYNRRGAITSQKAAEIIVNGIRTKKKIIQFPFLAVLATRLADLMPTFAYDVGPAIEGKGDDYPEVEEKLKKI